MRTGTLSSGRHAPGPVWVTGAELNAARQRGNLYSPDGSILCRLGPNGWALQAVGGAGGGIPVRITGIHPDSPGAGNVRIFRGDVYANGSEETATEEDVTIRIMGIPADVTSYPTSPLLGSPINQTWTNNVAVDVTEDVYEVQAFAWW